MLRYLLVDHAVPAMWRSLAEVERGLTVRECAHDAGAPPDLTQDALERVVGANPPPVLLREGVVGECLLDRRFHQPAARLRRRPRSFSITRMAFSRAAARSSLAWIALSMAAISRTLVEGTWLKMLRYQCTTHLCQAASRKNSAALSASPMQASEVISWTPFNPRSLRCLRNALQPVLSSFAPSQMPRISR